MDISLFRLRDAARAAAAFADAKDPVRSCVRLDFAGHHLTVAVSTFHLYSRESIDLVAPVEDAGLYVNGKDLSSALAALSKGVRTDQTVSVHAGDDLHVEGVLVRRRNVVFPKPVDDVFDTFRQQELTRTVQRLDPALLATVATEFAKRKPGEPIEAVAVARTATFLSCEGLEVLMAERRY